MWQRRSPHFACLELNLCMWLKYVCHVELFLPFVPLSFLCEISAHIQADELHLQCYRDQVFFDNLQSLLYPNERTSLGAMNLFVLLGGFPVLGFSCPVVSEPSPSGIFYHTGSKSTNISPIFALFAKLFKTQHLNTNYNQNSTFINYGLFY